ncbi:tetratricopeptide repeat protein [Larkinella insperata]|uniref:Tetratricopeptide repeat protein n=1 Tax=Larkinella insperata TaxID=332158 RepID=A0ABW3QBI2_9BACT|nr:tetratricopeptide repeat protein [Larkinella insperata]
MKFQKKALLTVVAAGMFGSLQAVAQDAQSGVKDLEAGRYNKAIQTFQGLATSAPSADNYFYLGYAQLKAGDPDAAKQAFEKGVAADAKNQLNNVGLGAVALAKKDRATAKTLIDNALKETKNKNMDVLLRAGEAYTMFRKPEEGMNDPAEAIRILTIADERDKKNENAEIEMALGDAYTLKNDGGNAVTKYENALAIRPNDAEAKYKIGNTFLRAKNYPQAQKFYEEAITADPEFAPTYEDLAEAFFGSRAYKNASKNMDLYIQKSQTTNVDKLLRSAQFDFLAGDNNRAIQKLDQLKGKVNTPVIQRIYGWAYSGAGKYNESIEALNNFIQTAPDRVIPDDYKYLGRAYAQLGTPEGDSLAIVNLEKAAPMDSTENVYREIGKLLYTAKKYDQSIGAWKKAILMDTSKATTNDYFQLGMSNYLQASRIGRDSTLMMGGDTAAIRQAKENYYTAADSAFLKVNQITPDWSPGYYFRASANYFSDTKGAMNTGEPVALYEKYLEVADKEIATDAAKKEANKRYMMTAYKFLSSYYANKNDAVKSREYLSKAAELDPNDKDVQNALNPPAQQPAATKPASKPGAKKPAGKATK